MAAVKLSDETELCEGCGQFKQIVEEVAEPRKRGDHNRFDLERRPLLNRMIPWVCWIYE